MNRLKASAPILDRFLVRFGKPAMKNMESAGERVWQKVFVRGVADDVADAAPLDPLPDAEPVQFRNSRLPLFAIGFAALASVLFLALVRNAFRAADGAGAIAVVADGGLHRIAADGIRAVQVGEELEAGEPIGTDDRSSAAFNMADGSRVEMRPRSKLSLERAEDGLRIRLSEGTIVVTAAKQRRGHFYVQTSHVTVSVVGTVFLVSAGELGSRVAVIEGEVYVQQGVTGRKLLAGEQIATNPARNSLMSLESPKSASEKTAGERVERPSEKPAAQIQAAPPVRATPTAPRPQFEVASVKRNNSDQPTRFGGGPGRYVATNTPLRLLIRAAYDIEDFQISGEPDWINSERYDIEATTDAAATPDMINGPLLQTLLEDRFKLKLHGETKDASVYFLTAAKNGPKLKAGACRTREPNAPIVRGEDFSTNCGFLGMGEGFLRGTSINTRYLTDALSDILRRKVLDKTGFAGLFDVTLKWAPDAVEPGRAAPAPSDLPSIFTALEEQLGLKLESGRAPIDVLVIDRVERPSEN